MDRRVIRLGKQSSVRGYYSSSCFNVDGEEDAEDSTSSDRSRLHRGSSDGEYTSNTWWQKGWNSVRKAGEWSETLIEEAGSRSGPKWRLFLRRLKSEGRSIYPPKQVRRPYDPFSYAQNFDEGSSEESDYPDQCFSARFAAPLSKPRGIS